MKALVLLLAMVGAAQNLDAQVKFNFSGVIGGYWLLGGPNSPVEASTTFATCCGKFYVKLDPKDDGKHPPFDYQGYPHSVRFKTGPLVFGDCAQGCEFDEGGQFDMISGPAQFLPCAKEQFCEYHARWLWSRITVLDTKNGARIYRFEGMLSGTYVSPLTPERHHVLAHFQQESLDQANLLSFANDAPEANGVGTLQVILSIRGQ